MPAILRKLKNTIDSLLKKNKGTQKRFYDVRNEEKTVQPNGTVHLPKKFLDYLGINAGETLVVALYQGDHSVRVRKERSVYDVLYVEKRVDQTGKIHLPKRFRRRLRIEAGNLLLVSLYEGFDEIRIRKEGI